MILIVTCSAIADMVRSALLFIFVGLTLATQEQLLTATRTRHPALRKTAAINDETIDDENTTNETHSWGSNNGTNGLSSFALIKRCNQPTATIVCTKSEPLSGEDISGITAAHHHRNTLPVHAHSVPPMRLSRLHDISAMNTVRSYDGNFTDETNGLLSDTQNVIKHQVPNDPSGLSTAYCRDTGVTLPLNSHLMPPKSVIQDDIRMKLGRFELVKKKGRSEVWNLFGQVLDTITGARLPYVACYACKVLYTDTGGGTGNMTRHRCPIGSSYKDGNINASTETTNDTSGQQSFETLTSGYVSQLSPDTSAAYRRESPAPPPTSHASLTAQSSFETSFSDYDRRIFCSAIMRCCAIDLLPPAIFQGDGMHGVIETAISIGRRCRCPDRQAISTLIPETSTLNQVIEANTAMVLSELTAEVGQIARTSGFSFSVERVANEDDIAVISANYITAEWKYKHRVVNVDTLEKLKTGLGTMIREAGESKRLLCVTENVPSCSGQAHLYCICYTLNNLIHEIFGDLCDQKHNVFATFTECQKIVAAIEKLGLDRWVDPPVEKRAGRLDYLFYGYEMLKYVKDSIQHLSFSQYPDIMALVRSIDWSVADEIRKYLEPFHIMASIFNNKSAVSFHMVQPEWFALIHEFSSDDEDGVSSNDTSAWICALRRKTENVLRSATESVIMPEHRMATVLNPRLKHLPVICSDEERSETYSRIRKLIGTAEVKNLKSEEHLSGTNDGEPPKKRISFLSSLEDHAIIDDELECYLRSQYPALQTKDVLQFWSTVGQAQFPHLSLLARFLLSIPAACVVHKSQNVLRLTPEHLSSLLLLRSSYAQTISSGQSNQTIDINVSSGTSASLPKIVNTPNIA
ncbi:Zinc finger protein [Dirofilaria immitis]